MSEEGGGGGSQSLQQSRASCFAELTELYTVDYLKLRQDSDIIHLYLQEFRIRYVSAVVVCSCLCVCGVWFKWFFIQSSLRTDV